MRARARLADRPTPDAAMLALDTAEAIGGLDRERFDDIASQVRREGLREDALRFRLAAAALAIGERERALEWLDASGRWQRCRHAAPIPALREWRARRDAHDLSRIPALLALLHEERRDALDHALLPLATDATRLVDKLRDIDEILAELLAGVEPHPSDRGVVRIVAPRVVLVSADANATPEPAIGSAPDPVPDSTPSPADVARREAERRSDDAGRRIDAAELVLRVGNVMPSPADCRRLGARTDLWIGSPEREVDAAEPPSTRVLLAEAWPLHRPTRHWRSIARAEVRHVASVPSATWHGLVERLGTRPGPESVALACLSACPTRLRIDVAGADAAAAARESRRGAPTGSDAPDAARAEDDETRRARG